MKKKNSININRLMNQQFSKYSSLNIPKNVLLECFNSVKKIQDESEIIFRFDKKIGLYIVSQIKKDDLDITINIIDKYSYIKKLIIKNPKYALSSDKINKIYEDAIDLLKVKYNGNELLSTNIVNNMKYIILNNNIQIEYVEETYDISFIKEYIKLYEIEKNIYASILGYDIQTFNKILDGELKINKEDLLIICSTFDVTNYDELKEIIDKKIIFHKYKEELMKKQSELKKHVKIKNIEIKEEKEKKEIPKQEFKLKTTDKNGNILYNLSFLKEYAYLYNLSDKYLSSKLHCGIGKVNDILNGKLLIKEKIIDDIAYEFDSNNIDDFYNKINEKINEKKENIKVLKK